MFSFQKLDVYRCSIELLSSIEAIASRAPKGYAAMGDQLRRASLSIPLNIAEGTGRAGRDAKRFFRIARGSAFECAAIIDSFLAVQSLEAKDVANHLELLDRLAAMLTAMGR
jgi:four helix bundle protein